MVRLALSVIPDDDWRRAALPLLEDGVVDALEWSPDQAWGGDPEWVGALLDHFAAHDRLDLHGVTLSPFSASWSARQTTWLAAFAGACARWRPRRVSEHVGFMAGGPFAEGAPLPPHPLESAIALGRDRLARLACVAGEARPDAQVGIEPLAFAFARGDVHEQSALLHGLLTPGPDLPQGGFLVLDLHNAWCQALNTRLDVRALLDSWPLARARVLHLSGGSWSATRPDEPPFRRDTHDSAIPGDVLALVPHVLARAPGLEVVVVERLGPSLADPGEAARHVEQVRALRDLLPRDDAHGAARGPTTPNPARPMIGATPREEPALARAQAALLLALEAARAPADLEALRAGTDEALAPLRAQLSRAEPRALEVAAELVRRWGRRHDPAGG